MGKRLNNVPASEPFEVVLDCEKLAHPYTGFAETLRQLRKAFSEIAPAHITFRPVFPSKLRDFQSIPGEREIRLPRWRKEAWVGRWVPLVEPFLKKHPRRVWHTTTQLAKYLPMERTTPLLLTVNDLSAIRLYGKAYADKKMAQLQRLVDRSTRIATISAFVAEDLRRNIDIGDRPVDVVHLAPSDFSPATGPRPDYMDDRPILFTIGTLEERKNLHVLIPMLAQLPREYHLIIAGKGSSAYAEKLKTLAKDHGVGDRVTLPGLVSQSDRTWLYQDCAAFLFPTLAEGFGLPALDALSFGKPAFVSRNTSLPEIVGEAGFFWDDVKNPDAMAAVVKEGMRAVAGGPEQHAEKARAQARHFTWHNTARQYIAIYEQMIGAN